MLNAFFALTLLLLPNRDVTLAGFLIRSLESLLFILSVQIVRREPTRKNKYIFVNFAAFFLLGFSAHIYSFIGPGLLFFTDERYARLYANQYVFYGLYFFLCAFSIAYLTLDVLFRDFRTYQKYLVTFAIVGAFFGYYYEGYVLDPKYTHHTADVADHKALYTAWEQYVSSHDDTPSPEILAGMTELSTWKNGRAVGTLYPEERLSRVRALYPYLPDNYAVLVYKPIWFDVIHMCVVSIGFILLFFGYLYMKDPPQGAYIEKIMFLLLVMCSLEILHCWTAIKTIEWQAAGAVWMVGQYFSAIVFLLMAGAFAMRLRFITSIKGEFYEQELATSPKGVTRWRDAMDNLVVEKFFNRKLILGRMFVESPTRRS
jgi:hypothetical protein